MTSGEIGVFSLQNDLYYICNSGEKKKRKIIKTQKDFLSVHTENSLVGQQSGAMRVHKYRQTQTQQEAILIQKMDQVPVKNFSIWALS